MNDIIKTKSGSAKGSCIISKDVIATIACSAALEVDGVSSMAQRPTNLREIMSSSAEKSVKVTLDGDATALDVYVNLFSGRRIPDVCTQVQQNVKTEVQSMTGKPITRVNVHVVGVAFEETDEEAAADSNE